MKKALFTAPIMAFIVSAGMLATTLRAENKKEVIALTPEQVRWFTPSYYKDGRERAKLFGDSSQGGTWVDRVKIPRGGQILAHTHPHDEQVTVLEGTWYLGVGEKFDPAQLKGYSARQFHRYPGWRPSLCRRNGHRCNRSVERCRQIWNGLLAEIK